MHWDPRCRCPAQQSELAECDKKCGCGPGISVIDQNWKYRCIMVYMYDIHIIYTYLYISDSA